MPTVIILAGGKGTRLQKVISALPKPLAPINTEPFLFLLIKYIASYGFIDFVLCTGHMASAIEEALASWPLSKTLNITISKESKPLGTAGAIKHAETHIHSDNFIVVNGDTFINLNYHHYLNCFTENNALALLALFPSKDHSASGSVCIDNQNRITGFYEKMATPPTSPYINAGVYLLNKRIILSLKPNANISLETTVFPEILSKYKQRIYGFVCPGDFIDIGTPDNYDKSQHLLKKYQTVTINNKKSV